MLRILRHHRGNDETIERIMQPNKAKYKRVLRYWRNRLIRYLRKTLEPYWDEIVLAECSRLFGLSLRMTEEGLCKQM